MTRIKHIMLLLFVFLLVAPEISSAQGSTNLTGAAPRESRHKFQKKIDTSGNLHKQSPKPEDLDPVRGPDVLGPCATKRMTFTDDTRCADLEALNIVNAAPSQLAMNASMKQKNNMNSQQNCMEVVGEFYTQTTTYTNKQKEQFNICRYFCETAYDTIENREFCGISDCLKAMKEGEEGPEVSGYCSNVLAGWATKTTGVTQNTIHTILTNNSNRPDIPDPAYCIDLWSSNGSFNTQGCCGNIDILNNYFPNDKQALAAQCN